jgi:hypothetical protein
MGAGKFEKYMYYENKNADDKKQQPRTSVSFRTTNTMIFNIEYNILSLINNIAVHFYLMTKGE